MDKDIEDIRAGGSKDGTGREEHGIVKRVRAHQERSAVQARRGSEINNFFSTQLLSQLKEEKGQIKENRKETGERNFEFYNKISSSL